ncbi:MAG: STAS/SEC14 domain-containing protein, partial [Gammaproteobacteria bacterium]
QLGLKYGKQFEKIAMYGNKMWQEAAAKIGSWFISGEMKYFDNYDDALKWLRE